jgi:heterodisulfide reductase subunit A-like polyferredoxin
MLDEAGERAMDTSAVAYDYDVLVIGSGFGGSVAALRLTEKGYPFSEDPMADHNAGASCP